ncbi:sigma-70 family RNA polymerase sigma factor [bacterium SCSIO 12741]|nr:sigma-70 family RNA polymerase sigma factor [bacterium SCSIO 12741]
MEHQIEQLYNPLFLFIRKRINNLEDAQDLTQEVFLKLANSDLKKIQNVKSWLYSVAQNAITDFYRKKKVLTEEVEDVTDDQEKPESESIVELGKCVASYIDLLPKEYREILRLSELEGLSQKDIATQLDMNYATVRSKIQRGRKKLKDVFTACCTIKQGGKGSIMSHTQNPDWEEKRNCLEDSC